jgi:diketogulonate reductase-like aldo/keto reductase
MMVRKAGGRVSAGVLKDLACIGYLASTMPVVSQVNFNPFAFGRALLDACQRHGVVLEAYSPLGTGRLLSNPAVGTIAAGAGRAPAQVLLRWCVQRGVLVLSKSTHRGRTAPNGKIFDFELTGEERAQRDGLDRTGGTGTVLESKWW